MAEEMRAKLFEMNEPSLKYSTVWLSHNNDFIAKRDR
jgi:hypothetical protein